MAFCDRSRVLLEPPLSISDEEVDIVLNALAETVQELAATAP